MATTQTVAQNGTRWVNIEMNTASGTIAGKSYKQFGPAYLTANDTDGHGHGYRLFLAQCDLPKSVDNESAAFAIAMIEFASLISAAGQLDVIGAVSQYGNGEYVADLRSTAWWVKD